jgi:hypothetical protein
MMAFVGPMKKGQLRPRFCKACDADITRRPAITIFCLSCCYKRQKVFQRLHAQERKLRAKASAQVNAAIKAGYMPRLNGIIKCVDCGKPAAHYDHRDYSRPLVVEPVCASCNIHRGPAEPYASNPPAWPAESSVMAALSESGMRAVPVVDRGKRRHDPRATLKESA